MIRRTLRAGLPACLLAWILAAQTTPAQLPGPGAAAGMNPIVTRLFSDMKGFTAKVEVQVLDSAQKEIANTPMGFAYLDQKLRIDLDLDKLQAANRPAGVTEMLKKMNMAQVTTIMRPDKMSVYVLFPGRKAMITSPLSPEDAANSAEKLKISKSPLGKEVVDGHPCTRNKVTITDANGQTTEATTWNASDLKDFPIRIETPDKDTTSRLSFKSVSLTKPSAAQFDAPADFTKYASPQELMQDMAMKMNGGEGRK